MNETKAPVSACFRLVQVKAPTAVGKRCFSQKYYRNSTNEMNPNWTLPCFNKQDKINREDERGPSSIRRTLEPFQRQRWGNFWETGWSAYGLFRAHRYHFELNWTLPCFNKEVKINRVVMQSFLLLFFLHLLRFCSSAHTGADNTQSYLMC